MRKKINGYVLTVAILVFSVIAVNLVITKTVIILYDCVSKDPVSLGSANFWLIFFIVLVITFIRELKEKKPDVWK